MITKVVAGFPPPPGGTVKTLFISGWAGYSFLFPRLSETTTFIVPFEPGYADFKRLLQAQKWDLIIAWSLGAHLCLKNIQSLRARRLVLAAPFLDFGRGPSQGRVLEMISGMDKNPQTTLRWFWKLCGVKKLPRMPVMNREALVSGLKYIFESRIDPGPVDTDIPVTLVQGRKDRIIPPEAREKMLECLPHASYLHLPYGHFIPEEELIKILYEQTDPETFRPLYTHL
jgi:pimeloyl-ACP methyl ester carboxylesterase